MAASASAGSATIELSPLGELIVGELDVFVGPNFVLSIRNRARQGFHGVRERAEREPQLPRFGSASSSMP